LFSSAQKLRTCIPAIRSVALAHFQGWSPQDQAAVLEAKDADAMLYEHGKPTWSSYCPVMSDLSTAEHYSGTDAAFVHGDETVGRASRGGRAFPIGTTRNNNKSGPRKSLQLPTQPPHLSPTTPHRNIPPNSGNTVAHPYRYHRHRHSSQIVLQHGWRR
jgi:hypothetical protein